jgi:hypothetical protein
MNLPTNIYNISTNTLAYFSTDVRKNIDFKLVDLCTMEIHRSILLRGYLCISIVQRFTEFEINVFSFKGRWHYKKLLKSIELRGSLCCRDPCRLTSLFFPEARNNARVV